MLWNINTVCFEEAVTPLTLQITTKAPRGKQKTSVYQKAVTSAHPRDTDTAFTHSCPQPNSSHSLQMLHHNTDTRQTQFQSTWSFDSSRTQRWQCIDFYFLFSSSLPLFSGSAGRVDGAVWRNPLSRHFSFPLTDRPWRAQAFGPPAWLAARQLNKPSSCYNSLKHFQLPESNKSSRQALGCSSTSNRTPQQVPLRLSFSLYRDSSNDGKDISFLFYFFHIDIHTQRKQKLWD